MLNTLKALVVAWVSTLLAVGMAQQGPFVPIPAEQVLLQAGSPIPPTNVTATYQGAQGSSTVFYVVIANYPRGQSPMSNMASIVNVGTVSSINVVTIGWTRVGGATSYDVLKFVNSPQFNGTCVACALVTGLPSSSIGTNDTGGALGAYTLNPVPLVQGALSINNQSAVSPYISMILAGVARRMPLVGTFTAGSNAAFDSMGNLVDGSAGGGLSDPGANGIVVRTALNTTVARTITAGLGIGVADGNGVAGNPTISADVQSVFGRTGAVVAVGGDYLASQVTNAYDTATDQSIGAHFQDISQIAVPANPGAGVRRLFVNSATGALSLRTSGGVTGSLENSGYTMQTSSSATVFDPADATTYFTGCAPAQAPTTTIGGPVRCYIPKGGVITAIYVTFRVANVLGSAETSTISFWLNDTTDTTISSVVTTTLAIGNTFSNTALAIAVVAGDFFELKWVTPTWVTNPTAVRLNASIYIDRSTTASAAQSVVQSDCDALMPSYFQAGQQADQFEGAPRRLGHACLVPAGVPLRQ